MPYRLRGFSLRFQDLGLTKPDEVTNYEIGIKGRELFGRLTYSVAGYYIDWSRFQFETVSPAGFFVVLNGSEARSLGVEVEARGNITDRLSLDFGYAYTDAQVTEDLEIFDLAFFTGVLVPGPTMFDGDPMPGVPEHSLSIGLDYLQPLKFGNGWTLNYNVNGSFRDKTQSTFNRTSRSGLNFYEMDSFWIWNASVTLDAGNWDIGFFVRNIGDEAGITGGIPATSEGFRGEQFEILRPRSFGLAVSYQYN